MELDLIWILIGLPVAFGMGWLASRLDLRQLRIDNRQAPRAYFKGLNFLLNEQQDKAIDAFIEAVQSDPDTSELHFALGNLFRRRGEYERAVRVHEHLLSRGDLSAADRQRAQNALAKDFLKAGLLDRAEDALRKLEGTSFEGQARLARLAIYERSREWPQARAVAEQLERSGEVNFAARLAHYLCEQARELITQGDQAGAAKLLLEAISQAPEAARARLLLGQLQLSMGQAAQALATLTHLFEAPALAAPLAAASLARAALAAQASEQGLEILQAHYALSPCIDVMQAIVSLQTEQDSPEGAQTARQRYIEHLKLQPSLIAASRWLAGETSLSQEDHAAVQKALEQAARPLARYRCAACGFEAKEHFWHCPGCQAWDSYPARRIEEL
ncbi:MAG: lipopolysaccharide assembly protein LapB [Betaproteobacteria bacterium]|jgi:lipopolysaccharide biosynthesis regulator YciM|nr:lipopolysaccharide assembly protein LapB [Burkholderiales bacterium]NBX89893.1 lipopolysaccharide assembly protein LapB [Betaproteobacteria bacterium]